VELPTIRLLLRPWRSGDEDALVRHADNPRISQNLRDRFPSPYTRADADAWIAHVEQAARRREPVTDFAIVVGGEAIGGVGVERFQDVFAIGAEIGYWLSEAHWGKGYATEALLGLVPYCFDVLGLRRLQASVYAANTGSARVLEKAGFELEGRLRRAVLKLGVVQDVLVYARLYDHAGAHAAEGSPARDAAQRSSP
jgi:ribosomal-protein-alanine N-acetyltransferase